MSLETHHYFMPALQLFLLRKVSNDKSNCLLYSCDFFLKTSVSPKCWVKTIKHQRLILSVKKKMNNSANGLCFSQCYNLLHSGVWPFHSQITSEKCYLRFDICQCIKQLIHHFFPFSSRFFQSTFISRCGPFISWARCDGIPALMGKPMLM